MSSDPLPSGGIRDAEEHSVAASRHLREVCLQAKLDYLRLQTGYQAKDDQTTAKLARVMNELNDLYSVELPSHFRRRGHLEAREVNYVGGRIPAAQRGIPAYSALQDQHCTYVASKNFKNSPFMQLKRAADRAVRYFGGGRSEEWTHGNLTKNIRNRLVLLSPLAKPTTQLRMLMAGTKLNRSPIRKNDALPGHMAIGEGHGQAASAAVLLLEDAAGPRPISPSDSKRAKRNGRPSPGSRKRNKVQHGEGGDATSQDTTLEAGEEDRSSSHAAVGHERDKSSSTEGARGSVVGRRAGPAPLQSSPNRPAVRESGPSNPEAEGRRASVARRRASALGGGQRQSPHKPWTADADGLAAEGLVLLERLRAELDGIKHELAARGLITSHGKEDASYERPPTATDDHWLQRAFSREPSPDLIPGAPRTFTACLLFQDRYRVSGYAYATEVCVWLTELGALEVRARNMDRAFDLTPLHVHPIFLHKLTGLTPEQLLEESGSTARAKCLEPVLGALRVGEEGRGLVLLVDPFIYEGLHPFNNRHFRVQVLRLAAGNGIMLLAEAASQSGDGAEGRLKLVLYDSELEVLLCHQPGLYRRVNSLWSTQPRIAEWLVARLSVYSDDSAEGVDGARVSTSHLVLSRNIHLPPERSWVPGEAGRKFTLHASQEGAAIVLECRDAEGGQARCSEHVPWVEVQAFIGHAIMTRKRAGSELLGHADDEPLPCTPLEYLLGRVSVSGKGVLSVDRVVYREVRSVSGCTVLLQGLVMGTDLVYRAQRIHLPSQDGAEEAADGPGGQVYSKGVSEKEAVRLMLREPVEVRRLLFAHVNRALLCRALIDMLRLVEERGVLRLETALYVSTELLKLAVRRKTEEGPEQGSKDDMLLLGSLLINSRTTLAQVRKLIVEKLDAESLPPLFVFETYGAPCSSKQEAEWLARDFLPILLLAPRTPTDMFDDFKAAAAKLGSKKAELPGPQATPGAAKTRPRPKTTGTDVKEDRGAADKQDAAQEESEDVETRRRKKAGPPRRKLGKKQLSRKSLSGGKDSVALIPEEEAEVEADEADEEEGEAEAKEADKRDKDKDRDREPEKEEGGEEEVVEEEERKASRRLRDRSRKKAAKGVEVVCIPLLARVTIVEGERLVQCSEDLTHVLRPGHLVRVEFPVAVDYKVSGHPDDVYCADAFTLDRPWVRQVPGLDGMAGDKPLSLPMNTKPATGADKHETSRGDEAVRARVQEALRLASEAAASAQPDPGQAPGHLEEVVKQAQKEEAQSMATPVLFTTLDPPDAGEAAGKEEPTPGITGAGDAKDEAPLQPRPEVKTATQDKMLPPSMTQKLPVVADAKAVSPLSAASSMRASSNLASPKSSTWASKAVSGTMTPALPPNASYTTPDGPIEYRNLRVFKIIAKSEDTRPQWRAEYDEEKITYKLDYRRTSAVHVVLHCRLRMARLESLCRDNFSTYKPLYTQRVDFFEKIPVNSLIAELHRKLTCGRTLGDALPVNTWQGFVQELDLLPKSLRLGLSAAKLNELLDPITAVPEDRRVMQARLAPASMPKPGGNDLARPNPGGRDNMAALAGMLALEEPSGPRWSDFLDGTGKIDFQGFLCLMREMAGLQYPRLRLDPEVALRTLLIEKLIFKMADLHALAWTEAKRLAMEHEAKRQAVAMRLQAHLRRKLVGHWYRGVLRCIVKIQATWRRAIHHWHYRLRLSYLEEDRVVRLRHVAAVHVQTVYRRYICRKKFLRLVAGREARSRELQAARRARQRERRRLRHMATLYRTSRVYSGVCTLIQIIKRDGRKASKNCDMIVRVYMPASQETVDFDLPEVQVRTFIERFVNKLGLSVAELTDADNVQCLANRLIVKKVGEKFSVVFSRRSASERGVQIQRRAARISGHNMVVTVYRTSDEWAFRAYDLTSCDDLRVAVNNKTLRKWLQDEQRKVMWKEVVAKRRRLKEAMRLSDLSGLGVAFTNLDKVKEAQEFLKSVGGATAYEAVLLEEEKAITHNFDPSMMHPKHQKSLLRWMVARIHMHVRKNETQRVLVMAYEIERLLKDKSAAKIQGLLRMWHAKKRVRICIRDKYEKRLDWVSKKLFYVNLLTETRCRKPKLLGPEDLPDPKDEFRPMKDMNGKKYYLNPATGQVSRMSPRQAARIMQRAIRRRLDRDFGRPSIQDLVKAMVMINAAPAKYAEFPDRLTACLNYALVLHTQLFDWPKARELYSRALKKGAENPVVLRCHAIFMLANVEEPRVPSFKYATELFRQAEVKDPGHERFKTAMECFFKWALVVQPQHPHALLNYAILMQAVVRDYDKAETYYRRALTLSPYDSKVLRNFEDYLQERLPGGVYGSSGPSSFVVRRSEVVETKELEWGEWQRLRDTKAIKPEFESYWYDSLSLRASWERPNFSEHLKTRIKRSTVIRNLGDWKQYKDPLFKRGFVFWCHSITYQLRLEDPFR